MLRIIAGEYRSRRLEGPVGSETTRPMPAHVKESIFNILREWFEGANVLDLFAGVGSMGLEAVSRGAKKVVMIEQNRSTFRILQENIRRLSCEDRAEAIQGDALSALVPLRAPKPVVVMFVDPPYRMMENQRERARVLRQIEACREILADRSFVVLRTSADSDEIDLSIPGFEGPETHRYGRDKRVHFYVPTAKG